MKFGICFAQYQDGVQVRESARLVESAGYDSLWVTENVHSGPEALEPMVVLSQFAAYTERITIGPAVVLLPLRNPVGFAHAVATVDHLSEGRFILGVGSGGNAVEGYKAYSVPLSERGKRCDETLEIMTSFGLGSLSLTKVSSRSFRTTPWGRGRISDLIHRSGSEGMLRPCFGGRGGGGTGSYRHTRRREIRRRCTGR